MLQKEKVDLVGLGHVNDEYFVRHGKIIKKLHIIAILWLGYAIEIAL